MAMGSKQSSAFAGLWGYAHVQRAPRKKLEAGQVELGNKVHRVVPVVNASRNFRTGQLCYDESTMGILDLLGLERSPAPSHAVPAARDGETETVRRIVGELDRLDRSRARFLAAFAYVLSRVAAADMDISDSETEKMVEIVQRLGNIPEEQAVLVVAIAKNQNQLFGSTEDYLVTREFRDIATDEQRAELLDCLFAVSAADATITLDEESQIREIANELGFEHRDFVEARRAYNDKRSVFKGDR
jgi:uncharacterized tellurite resistance protein B-like protein